MAIAIRELVIRAVVEPQGQATGPATQSEQSRADHEAIVAECVEQVLDMLRLRQER